MRRFLTIALFLSALPAFAQLRHQVFKIEFHSRIPTSILLSQSGLSENQTYTDDDLQLALARLRRLPFVYGANYTIDGSTIIFDVADEYRIFFHVDSLLQKTSGVGGGGGFLNGDVGARYYAPWGGLVQGTFGLESSSGDRSTTYTVQYAQYGIGGSRLFFVLGAAKASASGPTEPRYQIGYPLTLRQTITLTGFRTSSSQSEPSGLSGRFVSDQKEMNNEVAWRWDTTNDPLFAQRGTTFLLGVGRSTEKTNAESTSAPGKIIFSSSEDIKTTNIHGAAVKFWPLGRGAVDGSIDTVRGSGKTNVLNRKTNTASSFDETQTVTNALVGYVYNFFPLISQYRESRHRLEAGVGVQNFRATTSRGTDTTTFKMGQLGYVYRNRRGNVRFLVSYLAE